jgi:hypothetical protein
MPQLTFRVSKDGLALPVWIGWDKNTTDAALAAGQPILRPIQARGLVDTGSDLTAVAPEILQKLGLPVAGTASTHTAAGPVLVKVYEVSVSITDPNLPGSPMWTEGSVLVHELVTKLPDVEVLIGLNLLLRAQAVA